MFIDIFVSFLGYLINFEPFIYILSVLSALCVVLLIRELIQW